MLEYYRKDLENSFIQTLGHFGKVETIIDEEWSVVQVLLDEEVIITFRLDNEDVDINMDRLESYSSGLYLELVSELGHVSDILIKIKDGHDVTTQKIKTT